MKAFFTESPVSDLAQHSQRPKVAESEARRILAHAEGGDRDDWHRCAYISAEDIGVLAGLRGMAEDRLYAVVTALQGFVSSTDPEWIFQIGGLTHPKGLWRFGNVNGAKRLHVVNPPGFGQDTNHRALCGVVVESWVDNRTTPVCPACRKIMERREDR